MWYNLMHGDDWKWCRIFDTHVNLDNLISEKELYFSNMNTSSCLCNHMQWVWLWIGVRIEKTVKWTENVQQPDKPDDPLRPE